MWHACVHRKYYAKFITAGYAIDKIRYSGEENKKLRAPERARRFSLYLQVCCNIHRGKDFKYIKDIFFPLYNRKRQDKENVCSFIHKFVSCVHHAQSDACLPMYSTGKTSASQKKKKDRCSGDTGQDTERERL